MNAAIMHSEAKNIALSHGKYACSAKESTSKYKGVSIHRPSQKWQAHIRIEGAQQNLGLFSSEIKAAEAYNAAALKYYGEFALISKLTNGELS